MKAILGKKVGMTQVFTAEGKMVAATAIQALPNVVLGHRTTEKDGYQAVILGTKSGKRVSKPLAGQLKKAGTGQLVNILREFKVSQGELPAVASTVDISVFTPGEMVDIAGIGKGKGFAGVIKRHHFSRGPETHGSDHHRAPGSIGSMFPQRVIKGRRMPGHLGSDRVTVKKLEVLEIHPDQNILLVKGAVPGSKGTTLEIKASNHD